LLEQPPDRTLSPNCRQWLGQGDQKGEQQGQDRLDRKAMGRFFIPSVVVEM
jgi:hypothetical protein